MFIFPQSSTSTRQPRLRYRCQHHLKKRLALNSRKRGVKTETEKSCAMNTKKQRTNVISQQHETSRKRIDCSAILFPLKYLVYSLSQFTQFVIICHTSIFRRVYYVCSGRGYMLLTAKWVFVQQFLSFNHTGNHLACLGVWYHHKRNKRTPSKSRKSLY